MTRSLYLAAGMPRAGSGWHYNLVHDLIVASGGTNSRLIRQRYHLQRVLTEVNCNIGALTFHRVLFVLIPVLFRHEYVIKTHANPRPFSLSLIKLGIIRPVYIFRDPRDALLSAYEYGQRMRIQGRSNAFTHLTSIEKAIDFMRGYVAISETWLSCKSALHTRYENLINSYDDEIDRLFDFSGLDKENHTLLSVVEKYRPDRGDKMEKGTHFFTGKIGRYRHKLTDQQQNECLNVFGGYLERLGFPI